MPLDPVFDQLLRTMPPLVGESDTVDQVRSKFAEVAASPAVTDAAPAVGSVRDVTVRGGDGPVGARVYRPDGEGEMPTVVYLHGGGYVVGSVDTHDLVCREICRQVGAVVVSVEYRLAPEHPFPAGLTDCVEATRWVAEHVSELGNDPARIAVAGDSAGGTFAAVTAQELALDEDGPDLAAQLLIYPATDVSRDYPSRAAFNEGYFLDRAALELFAEAYVTDLALLTDPRMSPILHPKLAQLPRTIVVTAEFDPLRDQGEAYAGELREAGVAVEERRFDGLIHGFLHFGPFVPAAGEAMAEICASLRQALGVAR
ncbi:alpha/beta hydrolase [Haloechinothrix sp. YIM 98757]|uniref:Alpha/beta hydrolase n=1 Tax=Haloechinothrix aidingensis TaxID=2752311 RepID=A0A838ABR0_9PSEU|nr:alpha/beta hydrolase [Haloechinothrix aidingensis]